ncbi:hypothetical protein DFQ30_004747, partial [Apophysomyces sp. BC1015]
VASLPANVFGHLPIVPKITLNEVTSGKKQEEESDSFLVTGVDEFGYMQTNEGWYNVHT